MPPGSRKLWRTPSTYGSGRPTPAATRRLLWFAPAAGYDKETLMWDIVRLLDALGIESVSVAGHDWGGWIGMLLGMLVPERLERVLIMSVPHPWFRASLWTASEWWRTLHGLLLGMP